MPLKRLTLILLSASILGGCALSSLNTRHETAVNIAAAAAMNERIIAAGVFNLTVWERAPKADSSVNIYIEGDGLAWLNRHTKSLNPTPPDPLTLRLAAMDKAVNVIYMARPCQYSGWNGGDACPDLYWSQGRTAPEVIQSYIQALDNIKNKYHTGGFNLIGYSGGAGVAALLAAARNDILSLKTIAGNTDYAAFTTLHSISPMSASIDPITAAAKLAQLPQIHFIGGNDTIVPAAIFNSWQRASGMGTCIQSITVSDTSHEKGWIEKWPELLNIQPVCKIAP